MTTIAPDADVRRQALDPSRSFLVQAPAGSGKTELLVRRVLVLLAQVDAPEEIVAITFTRKAAAEMRERILDALASARAPLFDAADAHAREGWQLAAAARAHGLSRGFDLDAQPARLEVRTIDSLCASLAARLPLLSRLGETPRAVDDARSLYREAARRTFAEIDAADSPVGAALRTLALHLDNRHERLEALLAEMLGRRALWLGRLPMDAAVSIDALEDTLARWAHETLERANGIFDAASRADLLASARFAVAHLPPPPTDAAPDPIADLRALVEGEDFPAADLDALAAWRGVAALCLTKGDTRRKSWTIADGFPPKDSGADAAEKDAFAAAKARIGSVVQARVDRDALDALVAVRHLPPTHYDAAQRDALQALMPVLARAVAHLVVVFAETGERDHVEVAAAAVRALGTDDAPTDLAAALDARVSHLLLDEFQDTSRTQLELVAGLVRDWTPGDGRTLFAVGDPMQSIYRFRDADVGLFLEGQRDRRIAGVAVEPLTLCANFRAQAGLVEWVDRHFASILGARADPSAGRVPHAPAVAVKPALDGDAVRVHAFAPADPDAEAARIVAIVQDVRARSPDATIAVLVRNRRAIGRTLPALRAAGLRAQAVRFEPLATRPVVHDLLALARALAHPADRLAWLAVLRAPWCGLALEDLLVLAGDGIDAATIRQRLAQACAQPGDHALTGPVLGAEARTRASRVAHALLPRVAERGRRPLRDHVESAWLALGGPSVVESAADLDDAQTFLDLLELHGEAQGGADFEALDAALVELYAAPDPHADGALQVSTIHAAKGLEFDHVILAGLHAKGTHDATRLLDVLERVGPDGSARVALAPIRAAEDDGSPLGDWFRRMQAERARHELARLLYVAATRARCRLHLIGAVKPPAKSNAVPQPPKGSVLALLWDAIGDAFTPVLAAAAAVPQAAAPVLAPAAIEGRHGGSAADAPAVPPLARVAASWQPPPLPAGLGARRARALPDTDVTTPLPIEFRWAAATAKHLGTVVHARLQAIAEDGLDRWDIASSDALGPAIARDLVRLGVPATDVDALVARALAALRVAITSPHGRFVLGAHAQARNEWRLTGHDAGGVVHLAIDRTFVDTEGTRWIVDYKTSRHEGGGREAFLDREVDRYRAQLDRYGRLLQRLDPQRPVRLALYFPLMDDGWREWAAPPLPDALSMPMEA